MSVVGRHVVNLAGVDCQIEVDSEVGSTDRVEESLTTQCKLSIAGFSSPDLGLAS